MINVYLRWENFGLYVLVLEAVYLAGPPSDISNGDPGGMNTRNPARVKRQVSLYGPEKDYFEHHHIARISVEEGVL